MKKCIKFGFIFGVVFLAAFLFSYSISEARQGCCSRHGGVCGCGCCDGTGLSATCAPYYPECNSAPTYIPSTKTTTAPITTTKPTTPITNATSTVPETTTPIVPSNSMSNVPANALSATVNDNANGTNTKNQSKDDGGSIAGGVILLAMIGGFVWYFNKKNKDEKKDTND